MKIGAEKDCNNGLPYPVKPSKKVAIISYVTNSSHLNYGATLHGYAFQQVLHKKGVDSVVIDYLPKSVECDNLRYPILNRERGRSFAKFFAIKLNWLLGFKANIIRFDKFKRFIERNIVTTDTRYTYKTLRNAEQIDCLVIDTFVCESDVIWKVTDMSSLDENFFLDFPAARGVKKVAYAPTISTKELSGDLREYFRNRVSSFNAISARERAGAEYLSDLTGRRVETVLDPTLLLEADTYDSLCIKPIEEHYLLIYNVTSNDIAMVKNAMRFAQQRGLKVIEISNYPFNRLLMPHKLRVDAGIEEWLGYIKFADIICTNSFHGFCFSIIYKKDVYLFQRDNSDNKMQNIAEMMGMRERLIPCFSKSIPKDSIPIDYDSVYDKLQKLREQSIDFINKTIIG